MKRKYLVKEIRIDANGEAFVVETNYEAVNIESLRYFISLHGLVKDKKYTIKEIKEDK